MAQPEWVLIANARMDLHRKEHQRFANELAAFAEREARADTSSSVAIFAADPTCPALESPNSGGASTRPCTNLPPSGKGHDMQLGWPGLAVLAAGGLALLAITCTVLYWLVMPY